MDYESVSVLDIEDVWADIGDFEVATMYSGDLAKKIDSIFNDALDKVNLFTHTIQHIADVEATYSRLRSMAELAKMNRGRLVGASMDAEKVFDSDMDINRINNEIYDVHKQLAVLNNRKLSLETSIKVLISGLDAYKSLR